MSYIQRQTIICIDDGLLLVETLVINVKIDSKHNIFDTPKYTCISTCLLWNGGHFAPVLNESDTGGGGGGGGGGGIARHLN